MEGDDHDERSTVLRSGFNPTPSVASTHRVRVVGGPDAGALFTVEIEPGERVLLGQGPSCVVRLTDPSVSRRHAALERTGDRLAIVDLGSKNGTWVAGVGIGSAYLRGGELLRLGDTELTIDPGAPKQAAAWPAIDRFGRVIGASTEMRRLYPLLQRIATSTVPVVIEGETGTGKEALAEAIHESGPRARGAFVVFDCTAVPPSLIESELFGHERGAFTGAISPRRGVFEQADGGTLLIDEIGDLPLDLQPKLLRAIERGEVRRLGGERVLRPDVRLLAATRRDLDEEVALGRFRDDLFHRLSVVRVELPPLRRRRGDVAVLATQFCRDLGGDPAQLTRDLLRRWEEAPWPGNVRELRNAVARHLAVGDLDGMLPRDDDEQSAEAIGSPPTSAENADPLAAILGEALPWTLARAKAISAFRERYLADALSRYDGNVTQAARASGIALRYFQMLRARRE